MTRRWIFALREGGFVLFCVLVGLCAISAIGSVVAGALLIRVDPVVVEMEVCR